MNIRTVVLGINLLIGVGVFFWVRFQNPESTTQIIKLTQFYALLALVNLYITLMTTPITRTFTFLPYRAQYMKARRAFGVSVFFFGLLHASLAFFGQLGGFPGLPF